MPKIEQLTYRKLDKNEFTPKDIYISSDRPQNLHPDNRHVRDKIRQQLQVLRGEGVLEFMRRGQYRLK